MQKNIPSPYETPALPPFQWSMIPAKVAFLGGLVGGVLFLGTVGFVILLTSGLSGLQAGSATNTSDNVEVLGANDIKDNAANNPAANEPTVGDVVPLNDTDFVRGSKDAEVTLIEYSDFQCPYCQRFHPTAKQLLSAYEGKVNWTLRHFPLSFHENAQKASEASECAAKLGGNDAFWALGDKMFETGRISKDELPVVASEVGLDKDKFTACLNSGEFASKVQAGLLEGQKAGVTGTPGNILLNNKTGEKLLIPGAVPYAQIKAAVDQLLEG